MPSLTPDDAALPRPHPPDREADLLFERLRVELHEIGATALQHEGTLRAICAAWLVSATEE